MARLRPRAPKFTRGDLDGLDLDAVRAALAAQDDERAWRLIAASGRDAALYANLLYDVFGAPVPVLAKYVTDRDREVEARLQRIIAHESFMRL